MVLYETEGSFCLLVHDDIATSSAWHAKGSGKPNAERDPSLGWGLSMASSFVGQSAAFTNDSASAIGRALLLQNKGQVSVLLRNSHPVAQLPV